MKPGAMATIPPMPPRRTWTVEAKQFKSRSDNCPFAGWHLTGRATHTIVNGKIVWSLDG